MSEQGEEMSILPPAPVITNVAQLGKTFEATAPINGKKVPVFVQFVVQEGKICLVGVYRDTSGMGDWEDVSTSAGWKESIIKKIQQELMK